MRSAFLDRILSTRPHFVRARPLRDHLFRIVCEGMAGKNQRSDKEHEGIIIHIV